MWKLNKLASGYSWMEHTQKKKKKTLKNQVFWEEITFGFLGISSGSCRISQSSDSCARRRHIGTHHRQKDKQNKTKKKTAFFFLLCFSQIKKQNKPTNPQSEFDSKSKPWNFREREQKGISQFGRCCLLLLLLFWTGYLLLCFVNVLTFSGNQKRLYFSLYL